MIRSLSFILILLINLSVFAQPAYKNSNLPVGERVEDLLSRMTFEEKLWQCFMIPGDLSIGKEKLKNGLFGFQVHTVGNSNETEAQILNYGKGSTATETAKLINEMQKFFVEETRLGIPIIPFDEALHGLVRKGATAFPQSIALAATWDTAMMAEVAHAIARETKSRGLRQILSPVLNIARDVRWGRTEETYGEDTYLVTQMAAAFISKFEKIGIITTPKHFIANVGNGGRDSYPIHYNERLLEEVYFPAFKEVFQKVGARSVMTAYNSLDGTACSANDWLLNQKLKEEWGFDGFVISDANAVGGANVLHFTSKDYPESGKQSLENGLDVIFQTSYDHFKLFFPDNNEFKIDENKLNEAVRRVLKAKFELRLFENPYINTDEAAIWNGNPKHREIAREAAQKAIVLLKNNSKILPLRKNINSVAVIGTDAVEARLGGYSGPGNKPVSILDGLKNKLGENCQINYMPGCGREENVFETIKPDFFTTQKDGKTIQGLKGEYFNNTRLLGKPELTRIDSKIDFRWTMFSPDPAIINYDFYSVRWTGKITSPKTGNINIGIKGNDGYRLYINGKLIIDNWQKQSFGLKTKSIYLEKDKQYDIKLEFYESVGHVWFKLVWDAELIHNTEAEIEEAAKLAARSDAVIIVVGIEEGEGKDRAYLNLPGAQEHLIKRVAATGKPVVVVLIGGSAITMNNWIDDVPAIIDAWYPGEEGGNAIADVLFGDYNPAGRLPITFPIAEGQLPLFYNHKPTGRVDGYINLTGKSLFPFGYGLSYTKFEYSDLTLDKAEISINESAKLQCKIKNIGDYDGEEVIQLYIKDLYSSVARPVMELKGFHRIFLKKGETSEVEFTITPEMLSMLDNNLNRIVEPGDFRIMIGASSYDIRLRGNIHVNP